MRLSPAEIGADLGKRVRELYFIFGDEPLQMDETLSSIRQAARAAGYSAWELFVIEPGSGWAPVREATATLPLFGESRVVDVRVGDKLDPDGAAFLSDYAQTPSPDCVLLVSVSKVLTDEQKKPWFRAVESAGVTVAVRPLVGRALLQWLDRRMSSKGLLADQSGLALLAARVEGNLLAAAQEIEKLAVLCGEGRVGEREILDVVADSARFDVFDLVDGVLTNRLARAKRILDGLKAEGTPPPLVLWALAREVRALASLTFQMQKGVSLDQAFVALNPKPSQRRRLSLSQAAVRLDLAATHRALLLCAEVDRVVKGEQPGDPWVALMRVCLAITDSYSPQQRQSRQILPLGM